MDLKRYQFDFMRNHPIHLNRVIFMRDPQNMLLGHDKDDVDSDVYHLKSALELYDIEYNQLDVYEHPCFNETCDLFVFDWGGMGCTAFGGPILENYSRFLVKAAKENFTTKYLIFSEFSEYAIKDAIQELKKDKPSNIYFNMLDVRKEFDLEKGRYFPD